MMNSLYCTIPLSEEVSEIRARRLQEARTLLQQRLERQMSATRSTLVQRRANKIAFQLRRAMA